MFLTTLVHRCNHKMHYEVYLIPLITYKISLRIAPLVGNPEVGNSEYISHHRIDHLNFYEVFVITMICGKGACLRKNEVEIYW